MIFLCGCEAGSYETSEDALGWHKDAGLNDAGTLTPYTGAESKEHCFGRDICELQPQRIPRCTRSLEAIFSIDSKSAPAPRSNQYQSPSIERREALFDAMASSDMGQAERAMRKARIAGYSLCHIADTLVLYPDRPKLGGARIAWRKGEASTLILEAPHTFFDLGTNTQALKLFSELKARALIVSGTHRCASDRASKCDGRAQVCGKQKRRFKNSDMAHSTQSFFQSAHEYLSMRYEKDWIISLHGMSDRGMSVSDGTLNDLSEKDAATRFGQSLMKHFPEEYVSSCNHWGGAKMDLRLCGTTNVQGRFTNGAILPCIDEAPGSSGRFIHLEQSKSVRKKSDKIALALRDALAR